MTTVKSLPELRAQKRKLDNHMNLLYGLLSDIKTRKLDKFHEVGQALLSGVWLCAPMSQRFSVQFWVSLWPRLLESSRTQNSKAACPRVAHHCASVDSVVLLAVNVQEVRV